jgi:hypothetical protein
MAAKSTPTTTPTTTTPTGHRAQEATTVGSLVVLVQPGSKPQPALVCGIGPGAMLVYVLRHGAERCALREVPHEHVEQLALAVLKGTVSWPYAADAARHGATNTQTVLELIVACVVLDGRGGDLARVAQTLSHAGNCLLRSRTMPGQCARAADDLAALPAALQAPRGALSSGLPDAVLRRLRDGEVNPVEGPGSERVAEMVGRLVQLSGALSREALPGMLLRGEAARYCKEMSEARTFQERKAAAARALHAQQCLADVCRVSPMEALLAPLGMLPDMTGPCATLYLEGQAARVSFAPNLLFIAAQVVRHVRGPFVLVDVGCGAGAASAAFDQAIADAAAAAAAASAASTMPATSAGPGRACGGGGGPPPNPLVYRASNTPSAYDLGPIVARKEDGVVETGPGEFARVSLELVEPRRGDPVHTEATEGLVFERCGTDGESVIVKDRFGKVYAVPRADVVFCTVVFVGWAPDGPENYLLEFLCLLLTLQRPLPGLHILISGEGRGGCTGNGHPFVHAVLSATPSLHEHAFSEWRAQAPGIASKATLYLATDVVATLRTALQGLRVSAP